MVDLLSTVLWAGFGFLIAYLIPIHYKGRPILAVFIVYCRRTRGLKWLAWQVFGDSTWYFDIVEREVFKAQAEE